MVVSVPGNIECCLFPALRRRSAGVSGARNVNLADIDVPFSGNVLLPPPPSVPSRFGAQARPVCQSRIPLSPHSDTTPSRRPRISRPSSLHSPHFHSRNARALCVKEVAFPEMKWLCLLCPFFFVSLVVLWRCRAVDACVEAPTTRFRIPRCRT